MGYDEEVEYDTANSDYSSDMHYVTIQLHNGKTVRAVAADGDNVQRLQQGHEVQVRKTHWLFSDTKATVYELLQ